MKIHVLKFQSASIMNIATHDTIAFVFVALHCGPSHRVAYTSLIFSVTARALASPVPLLARHGCGCPCRCQSVTSRREDRRRRWLCLTYVYAFFRGFSVPFPSTSDTFRRKSSPLQSKCDPFPSNLVPSFQNPPFARKISVFMWVAKCMFISCIFKRYQNWIELIKIL